ncbi:type I-F CRISPR-associated protein Csy1 [Psychrobacter sp. BI730]|uniref:type I-F CRISPR-associated protein Csy1 n=1 Tax=Psychrobacter sp. BI730 TaxID=2705463 RepID=UPI0015CE63BF|nr:type I-F CRISPR-associated protein Csy1 [Psychrobacter sp. BI730]NYR09078.1 type I-F CRISPR-associated protein Csy1 [Psychrobacter sp. BI730]
MNDIPPEATQEEIHNSIVKYLEYELELETMKAFKDKIPTQKSIDNKRAKLKPDFEYRLWLLSLQDSLEFMQNHDLSLATHISKGIHSAVRSDNLLLEESATTSSRFVNSYCVPNPKLDANSNNTGSHAGHLKIIINFLNIEILDGRFYSLIKDKNPNIQVFFEQKLTMEFFNYLVNLLNFKVERPITDGRNKQTLFPIENNLYHCVIPLFPSSLTHYTHQNINEIKYSNASKEARKVRFSSKDEKGKIVAYRDILNLAVIKLGGENAQNVSRLNNVQGGFHYLLPSLPPIIKQDRAFKLSKFANSIFSTGMEYNAREAIQNIFKSINDTRNIVDVRDARKRAIDEVLYQIFAAAEDIRNTLHAGWSTDYELDHIEKLWLDPKRADLDGQAEFKAEREEDDAWHSQIIHRFARWLNTLMQAEFKQIASDFGDAEHLEWEREIEDMKKRYERAGKGVFL